MAGRRSIHRCEARGEEVDRSWGWKSALDDYLAKPFGPRELLARVRAVAATWQRQCTLAQRDRGTGVWHVPVWDVVSHVLLHEGSEIP